MTPEQQQALRDWALVRAVLDALDAGITVDALREAIRVGMKDAT